MKNKCELFLMSFVCATSLSLSLASPCLTRARDRSLRFGFSFLLNEGKCETKVSRACVVAG